MSQYIAPEEAIKLSAQNTVSDMFDAMDIFEQSNNVKANEPDLRWKLMCAVTTVYNAGRVAGIRQERAKRNRGVKHVQ